MTLEKICIWKKVFEIDGNRWRDIDRDGCHSCEGKNESCPDYFTIYQEDEATIREIAELKARASQQHDYKINRYGVVV